MSPQDFFETRIVPVISLSKFDESWCRMLAESSLFKLWLGFKSFCCKQLAPLAQMGLLFEIGSFAAVVLLFLILPAPQFADDKNLLALMVMAAFFLRLTAMLLNEKVSFKPCALDMTVLAFLAMNVIATAASHYLEPSIKGLSKMAVYICSYYLFVGVLQKSNRQRSLVILAALLGAGLLVSLYGVYQYKIHVAPLATWEDPTLEDHTTRVYSTLKNPNLLAGYLVPLIPLGCGLTIMSLCQGGVKRLLSFPAFGVAAVITLCCVFTGSRGGYLGIAAGLAALALIALSEVWSSKPKLRPLLILVVVVIPALLVFGLHFFPKYEHRVLSIFAGREHSSNSYRLNVYTSSLKMFFDSWWLGVGPGNNAFKLAYGLYMRSGFDALGTYCVPLEVAVESGVIGLSVFVWLVLAALARAHQNFWRNRAPERWIAAGAAAGLIGMMVHGLFDTVFYRPQVQFIFWLLLALCICSCLTKKPESSSQTAVLLETAQDDGTAA
jgi:putative inorganic carbon (hco3(-)) transporter